MYTLIFAIFVVIIFLKIQENKKEQSKNILNPNIIETPKGEPTYLDTVALNYESKNNFFSQSEFMFFKILEEENNNRFLLLSKVRFEDLVNKKDRTISGRGYVKSRHIDFVIVCKNTGKVHSLIELDGNSHNSYRQKGLDEVKDKIASSAYKDRFHRIKVGTDFRLKIKDIFSTISC